jgi:hypothetical protein
MLDTADALTNDLLAPSRRQNGRASGADGSADSGAASGQSERTAGLVAGNGNGFHDQHGLEQLKESLTGRLPWVSRVSGEPAGMWVEHVGYVDNEFEPFPRGTPFAWIGVDSWDAADAVYESLHEIARIEDSRWIGGWFRSDRGFRKIKIYPPLP